MKNPSSNANNASGKIPPPTIVGNVLDFIRWDAHKMSTGVASVDAQHQELISRINELHRATLAGVSSHDIEKIIIYIGQYAETHFKHEEGFMEERQCPVRVENRLAHSVFLREYQTLAAHFHLNGDPAEMAVEIKKMVAHWLSAHICRVDLRLRDYRECVKEAGK
jgi:hemerythrin